MKFAAPFIAITVAVLATSHALAQTPAATPPAAGQPPGFTAPPRADTPAAPGTAGAAEHTETTATKSGKTGRDIYIGGYITMDSSCKVGKQPTVEFTTPPANGVLKRRRDAYNLRNAPGGRKCLGISPDGLAVIYASKPRFKGEDSFAYTVTFGDGRTRTVKATVTVQ